MLFGLGSMIMCRGRMLIPLTDPGYFFDLEILETHERKTKEFFVYFVVPFKKEHFRLVRRLIRGSPRPEQGEGGALIYNYKPVCLCMLYCFLSSFVGNTIIKGSKSAYKFFIVTLHADEIDAEILEKLHHSATRLRASGAYSNEERDVIVCVINKRQLVEFEDILKKYDNTFAFVETVNETIGMFAKVK